jgi:glycosyltransferase involved in cell wall biosynthesis
VRDSNRWFPVLDDSAQIRANARAYERLVAVGRRRLAAGRLDSAAAWTRVAAAFATTNPHGPLRDVRLDETLDEISRAALPACAQRPPGKGRRRVLHVLSEGHLIGGHLRMAARWIESDAESASSVTFTRPGFESPQLASLARQHGGTASALQFSSLIERARLLRAAGEGADVVVCHTHCDDPVPAIAFGGDYTGPPVVMVNHADHVFGLGAGNVSLLVSQREIAAEVAVSARGYPQECQFVSPLPLPGVERGLPREEAKRQLGIDPAQVVALTLARPVKYRPAPWHPGFGAVMGPALAAHPELTLLAIGPNPDEPEWRDLAAAAGPGRVLVPGMQDAPGLFLDAADIYLDSFPFASITSMLEAAARGVPVLASRMYGGMQRLMSSAGPLDEVALGGADPDAYRAALASLVGDPLRRRAAGEAAAAAVRESHGGAAWALRRELIYARAASAVPVRERSRPLADEAELAAYAEALMGIESRSPLLWTIGFCREGFDRPDRRSAAVRSLLVRSGQVLKRGGAPRGPAASGWLIPSGGTA